MKKNIFKYLILGIALSSTLVSCRKDAFVNDDIELKDGGKTLVKFLEGPTKTLLFDAFTNIKPIEGFSLRREANSNAALAPTTIQLVKAAVPAGYTFLPDNVYTLQTATAAKYTRTATGLTVNLANGDFAADFDINVNGALLDPNAKYALAYTIANAGNGEVTATTQKAITVVFTIKSQYDGVYSFEAGSQVVRYTNGVPNSGDALMGSLVGQANRSLITIDGTSLSVTPIWASGGGVAGIDGLQIKIDPVTNLVTMSATGNNTLRNIAGKPNDYDPITKTFRLNFEWWTAGTVTPPTREITMNLKYVGKRP